MNLQEIMALEREASSLDEDNLWKLFWESPDSDDARIRLVELYLPLVVKVVNKLSFQVKYKVQNEELLSAGVLGLHDAISNYVKGRDATFASFAYKRIRGAMMDDLRSRDPLTRTQREHYKAICAAINHLTAEFSRLPTDQEIAEHTNMKVSDVDMYIAMGSEIINLDEEFEHGLSYLDIIPDKSALSPSESAHRVLAIEEMREHFRELDEREQKLLFLRHFEELSVKEIAHVLEVSEGRVSQIYHKIVLKLRALMGS